MRRMICQKNRKAIVIKMKVLSCQGDPSEALNNFVGEKHGKKWKIGSGKEEIYQSMLIKCEDGEYHQEQ